MATPDSAPSAARAPHGSPNPVERAVEAGKGVLRRVDRFQREHRPLALPVAVIKKFGDDRAGALAVQIAYYMFFSLFPLLLVLVTVSGFVLSDNPELQQRLVGSALQNFPVVGDEIRTSLGTFRGSGIALAVGIAGAVWGGMGALDALQNAMNSVWNVPLRSRPNIIQSRLRGFVMLVVLGAAVLATTLVSSVAGAADGLGVAGKALALAVSILLNAVLWTVAFKVLTDVDLDWRTLVPGAVFAGVVFSLLQYVGGLYVDHVLNGASRVYGTFAVVIGLLSYLYLQAQVIVLAAEINVVVHRGLWPRGLDDENLTEQDTRALHHYAAVEERIADEKVRVHLGDSGSSEEERPPEQHP